MKLLHRQNMKLVVFDFDGTIADTSEGILDAHRYTLEKIGRNIPSDDALRSVIGGNLLKTYIDKFGLSEGSAKEAVKIYRERYSEVGIHKANVYPGFYDMLCTLKNSNIKLGVATLKAESFAKSMLMELGLFNLFDEICGMDSNDHLDKAGILKKCAKLCGCSINETVLVGDSENDLIGAQNAGAMFIGVTYGFGFSITKEYDFVTANNPTDILDIIL